MATNPDPLQVSFQSSLDGKHYTNQVHYRQNLGDSFPYVLATIGTAMGGAMTTTWSTTLGPLLADAVSLDKIVLTEFDTVVLNPPIPPAPLGTPQIMIPHMFTQFEYTGGLPIFGVVEQDYLPAFNSYRARKISLFPGRKGKGHNNFSGVPEPNTLGNLLGSTVFTDWQTNANALLNGTISFTVSGVNYNFTPVVFSIQTARIANIPGSSAGLYASAVQTVVANQLVGTMRRRKRKTV